MKKSSKGLWFKFIDGNNTGSGYREAFTKGKWYQCRKDDYNSECAFYDNNGILNGWSERNNIQFDVSNPKTKEPKNTMQHKLKLEVTVADVLEIHSIACVGWKSKIATTYLPRLTSEKNIKFSEEEVKEMFDAANNMQLAVLEKIFGKLSEPIEWDEIKAGSKVKIKYTGEHCNGISEIDINEPVVVVLYKTPYLISNHNIFYKNGVHKKYCTFNQNGKFVSFSANTNELPYITEVIEY